MTVTRLIRFDGEGSVKAYCDLAVGGSERPVLMTLRGLRVVEGKRGLFVTAPRQQGKDSHWYDVVVFTKETAREVAEAVLSAYRQESQESPS